jgi:hypothetical protein
MNRDQHFIPAIIATAVAAMGLGGLLLVNHGPWNKPKVKNETMIHNPEVSRDRAGMAVALAKRYCPTPRVVADRALRD